MLELRVLGLERLFGCDGRDAGVVADEEHVEHRSVLSRRWIDEDLTNSGGHDRRSAQKIGRIAAFSSLDARPVAQSPINMSAACGPTSQRATCATKSLRFSQRY